ncbi:hypothetical protein AAEX28_16060 [Lentisphaerota bacterium WC36G]
MISGGKGTIFENGVNAPFIVSGPTLIPQNCKSNALVDFTDMLATTVDIGGGKIAKTATDGYSIKRVLYGNAFKTARNVIVAYGGGRSKMQRVNDGGVQNEFYFRERVLRYDDFKAFVSPERKIAKIINVKNDPFENINLMDASQYSVEYLTAKNIFEEALKNMSVRDQNPKYNPNSTQHWEKDNSKEVRREIDRIAHPNNPKKDKKGSFLKIKKKIYKAN